MFPSFRRPILTLAAVLSISGGLALADDVPEAKRTRAELYLTAIEAAQLLENPDAVLVDVRSRAEVAFLGLPRRTNVHMPYMVMPMMGEFDAKKGGYALEINPDFPRAFRDYAEANGITAGTPIVLICRSGTRSARAADVLFEMGYRNVYSILDGFEGDKAKDGPDKGKRSLNGWKNAGLDWSYEIEESQAYPPDRM